MEGLVGTNVLSEWTCYPEPQIRDLDPTDLPSSHLAGLCRDDVELPSAPGPVGTFEVSSSFSILKKRKKQDFFPRILVEVDTGMCCGLLVPSRTRAVHLYPLAIKLMNAVRVCGRNGENFFLLQSREYIFPHQERDLGRPYLSTINSKQGIAHSLNNDCCPYYILHFIDSCWIIWFGLWNNSEW